ncbi:MAG TPA: amylo-alpha-1,6-glucosidase [Planctomycetes bacterium]|nr:amylo-alpha-1,6-glucosidase [Planctomycetota bacterium]HIJ71103.1 amylo-alpha-1,6-glucosidase [Planctomycetota bacterium]
MNKPDKKLIERGKKAAIEVLLHNMHGPYRGLPRTAGWGYPEPYTRDLMISSLGILVSGNKKLVHSLRRVLETLAGNQSRLGHIPSLVHDSTDRGSSDCTPLFLMTVALYRKVTGENGFLEEAVKKSMLWMEYQSPSDRVIVDQLPTSDWRDEQWVLGYGLFVNTLVYIYLRLFGQNERAVRLKEMMGRFTIKGDRQNRHVHEGLVLRYKPYYALWSYKVHRSERFDLLGNSLAILSGIASASRSRELITWIETECESMRKNEDLAVDMPPNFFPYIRPGDPDWMPRYKKYNQPGEYHNGGIWPFICGFYIAALVAARRYRLAEGKLVVLTELLKPARQAEVNFGFNEWIRAQDGTPQGQDWQSWSAAMYVYAAACVEKRKTPFFDEVRKCTQNNQ